MPNAFGFQRLPQRGTPDPTRVGLALVQQRMTAPAFPPMPTFPSVPSADAAMRTPDAAMRNAGAELMGGPGQTELGLSLEQGPSAINTAIGEALTRLGGGAMPNPSPFKPRAEARRQLQHLGLSEAEADLLIATGGA